MKNFFSVVLLSAFLSGCLQSPLLNHAVANEGDESAEAKKGSALVFPQQELSASITWIKEPADEEAGSFTLRFWSTKLGTEQGPYVDPGHVVAVKLWMPSMGHGSSPVKVEQIKDQAGGAVAGVYEATDVFFSMGGKWEIWVQLKKNKADKTPVEQAKIDYSL